MTARHAPSATALGDRPLRSRDNAVRQRSARVSWALAGVSPDTLLKGKLARLAPRPLVCSERSQRLGTVIPRSFASSLPLSQVLCRPNATGLRSLSLDVQRASEYASPKHRIPPYEDAFLTLVLFHGRVAAFRRPRRALSES